MYYPDPESDATVAPWYRTVGHEAEYATKPELANVLLENHLSPPGRTIHAPHCQCVDADNYPLHSVDDSSAHGGEYHIGGNRGVLFGSPAYMNAVRLLSKHTNELGSAVTRAVGFHTHVGTKDARTGVDLTPEQKVELLRIYLTYETQIHTISCGAFSSPRDNHHTPKFLSKRELFYGGNSEEWFWKTDASIVARAIQWPGKATLNMRTGHGTIEFRIWNATRSAWRMYLAGGISCAIVEAAAQNRTVGENPPATLVQFLHGLLTPDLVLLVNRQIQQKTRA